MQEFGDEWGVLEPEAKAIADDVEAADGVERTKLRRYGRDGRGGPEGLVKLLLLRMGWGGGGGNDDSCNWFNMGLETVLVVVAAAAVEVVMGERKGGGGVEREHGEGRPSKQPLCFSALSAA